MRDKKINQIYSNWKTKRDEEIEIIEDLEREGRNESLVAN